MNSRSLHAQTSQDEIHPRPGPKIDVKQDLPAVKLRDVNFQVDVLSRLRDVWAATASVAGKIGIDTSRTPYPALMGAIGVVAGFVAISAVGIYVPVLNTFSLNAGVPVLCGLLGGLIGKGKKGIALELSAGEDFISNRMRLSEAMRQLEEIDRSSIKEPEKKKLSNSVLERFQPNLRLPPPSQAPVVGMLLEKKELVPAADTAT